MKASASVVARLARSFAGGRSDEAAFLPAALEIVETPASPTGRLMALAIATFTVFATVWAVVGRVDVMATAVGSVLPAGMIKVVQAPDTGVVQTIQVQDGDHVRAGQVLIELDPTAVSADHTRLAQDTVQASLDVARLQALAEFVRTGRVPSAISPPPGAPAALVDQAVSAMQAQAAEQAAKTSAIDEQIREKGSEAAEVRAQIEQITAAMPFLEEKNGIHERLQAQGYGTTFALLDAEQSLTEARHQLLVLDHRARQAEAAQAALARQRQEAASEFSAKTFADLASAQQRRTEASQELLKAGDRLGHTEIRAPADGVAEQVGVHTVGAVVTPAEHLMTIVPDHRRLMVQALLPNREVGFVHPGQPVQVKVEAFNFTRYGLLQGRVVDVSHDVVSGASQEREGEAAGAPPAKAEAATYAVRIALDRASMTIDGATQPLLPGMVVVAEIRTGQRSILEYLLSPLSRAAKESLHER